MENLYQQLSNDIRFREGLKSCISCGTCTAICPAAQFSDYDPRNIVEIVQRKDDALIEQLLMSDRIWRCGECLSCKTRCPRGNTPGYIVQSLRELSIKTGLFAFSEQGRLQLSVLKTAGRDILKYGYCVYIDEVDNDQYPEQGPVWEWYRKNKKAVLERLGANYNQPGPGTLRKISDQSIDELRRIFIETGAMDRFHQIEKTEGREKNNEE